MKDSLMPIQIAPSVAVLAIIIILICYRRRRRRRSPKRPPGPRGIPLLGNLSIFGPNLHHRLALLSRTHGPIMQLRLGTHLYVVVSSPDVARQIYRHNDAIFCDHDRNAAATIISYGGSNLVRSPHGPTWKMLRSVFVHHLMNARSLEAGAGLRRRELSRAVREIGSRKGSIVNVRELAFDILLNTVMSTVCGDDREGGVRWREKAGGELRRVMMEAVEILGRVNMSDFVPGLSWFDVQRIGREMRKRVAWLDRVYESMIEERMRFMEGGDCDHAGSRGEESEDLLSMLLKIRDGQDPRLKLSHTQLKCLMMDLLVGGTSGTWTTIEWLMAELMQRPNVLQLAREETDRVVGRGLAIEESAVTHLRYIRCLVKETLRLHSPVPLLVPRVARNPCVIAGYIIPAGARVITNVQAIHTDPVLWKDPLEFRPERFLEGAGGGYIAGEFSFFPFGAGRRKCPGLPLISRLLPLVAATLLHLFEWRTPEGEELDFKERSGITLSKEKPLLAISMPRFPSSKELYE